MPSPYVYTRRRRILLQVVMIAILAGTMGLAALVRKARVSAPPTKLGPAAPLGLFTVSMPDGWTLTRSWKAHSPLTPALQGTDKEGGRKLTVTQRFLDYDVTPESYLETFHEMKLQYRATPVQVAGADGRRLVVPMLREGLGGSTRTIHQIAVAVFDHRVVLEAELESPGEQLTATDARIFQDVLGSVRRKPVEE